jgi:hypothetical protein
MRFDPFSTLQDFLAGQREHVLIWVPVFLGLGAALYFALPFEPSYLSVGAALSATATLFLSIPWLSTPT